MGKNTLLHRAPAKEPIVQDKIPFNMLFSGTIKMKKFDMAVNSVDTAIPVKMSRVLFIFLPAPPT